MSIAQGINKVVSLRKQTGLGVVGSATPQKMRRETASFNLQKATFENKEIASHQQSSGITHGLRSTTGNLSGVLSPGTYNDLMASLLRKAFTATTPQVGKSITIGAASGEGIHTITVTSGTLLTGGFKIGDVVRFSAGALNAANINTNVLITAIASDTSMSVYPVNGTALVPEGPIAGCTITVQGKKSIAADSSQTVEYWQAEEWFNDISVSDLYNDLMVSSVDIGLPSDGNVTMSFAFAGLDKVTSGSQVHTGATAETTSNILTAVNGVLMMNGKVVGNVTGASIKIDCGAANMGAVVGSNVSPDIQRGRIQVSGQVTAFFQNSDFSTLYDAATQFGIVIVCAASDTATAHFMSFNMQGCKFSGDTKDDGEKGIVQTIPFTAQIYASGSATTARDHTIISIQDSLA